MSSNERYVVFKRKCAWNFSGGNSALPSRIGSSKTTRGSKVDESDLLVASVRMRVGIRRLNISIIN